MKVNFVIALQPRVVPIDLAKQTMSRGIVRKSVFRIPMSTLGMPSNIKG
jgi:hypothetical protein